MIYQGIRSAPQLQKTLYFCDFSRGVRTPCPPLDLHMSSMMRYHLQDFSMSEHLQVINLLHISLYQRNFYVTLKWTIIIFIQILTLLFQGMMPHNSHIIPRDDLRPPILSYRNYKITFVLFIHIFMHMYISCSCCFSALQKLLEFGIEVMFWSFIGDPVHYIYHNITLFHAFNIYADTHASILLFCYP